LEGSSRGAVGPIRRPKRSFLDYIYKHCNDSCPEDRNWDDYGLPVPKMEEAHHGIEYSFVSEDVWRCYAPGFMDCWEEYETRFDTSRKIKQVAAKAEFWDRPPGAMSTPARLDTHWTARQMGRGREYVTIEKCWCMYPRSDTETCMALWVCINLDPDHAELSPGEPIDRRFTAAAGARTVQDAPSIEESSIVGGYGVRAENTGWVNVLTFNLLKLARKLDDSFVVLWAGFRPEYYAKAEADQEWNKRFKVPFHMQLVSDEFLESQAAVAYTDPEGRLRMGFSTDRKSADRKTPPREDPNVAPRETLLPDGRVTRTVTSLTTIHELQPLGNPLIDETLPSDTPDEKCMRVLLKDSDGSAHEIKTKKPVEIITDINDPAVVRWFEKYGPGKPDYSFWGGQDEMKRLHPGADMKRLYGSWDATMTDDQYLGLEEWPRDIRYYNCRSRRAFSNAEGERKGEREGVEST
ncbi:MAG: hypothetical protein QF745_05990, partial [Planctomycetota bacterium]|nr:hypothetical protein [Planctomycetota bacterium]